jgi:hypothetical protein
MPIERDEVDQVAERMTEISTATMTNPITEETQPQALTPAPTPTPQVQQPTDAASDLLLDRLRTNARLYPQKRAMAFLIAASKSVSTAASVSSASSAVTSTKIEREISYAELEHETDRLALSLQREHQLKKGDRYVYVYFVFYIVDIFANRIT